MVDFTRPDILVVSIVVLIALISLIIVTILWAKEKRRFRKKQKEVLQGASNVEHSPFVD